MSFIPASGFYIAITAPVVVPAPAKQPTGAASPQQFAQALAEVLSLSDVMVGALNAYPHGNPLVEARLLGFARALPVEAAASSDAKAAFNVLAGPYLDSMGLAAEDHNDHGARAAFAFVRNSKGSLKQAGLCTWRSGRVMP